MPRYTWNTCINGKTISAYLCSKCMCMCAFVLSLFFSFCPLSQYTDDGMVKIFGMPQALRIKPGIVIIVCFSFIGMILVLETMHEISFSLLCIQHPLCLHISTHGSSVLHTGFLVSTFLLNHKNAQKHFEHM